MKSRLNFAFNEGDKGVEVSVEAFEIIFDKNVKDLLAAGHTHKQLISRLRQVVLAESQALPVHKVTYSLSYGGYMVSKRFRKYLEEFTSIKCGEYSINCARDDPGFIDAFADFGRSICDELPYVLADFRTSKKWRLEELMRNTQRSQHSGSVVDMEKTYADLMVGAKAFYDQRRSQRSERTNSRSDDQNFVYFAKHNSDQWMQHDVLSPNRDICGPSSESLGLGFAHELLVKDIAKYGVGPDERQDAAIYERVGVLAATASGSMLAIAQVPALVDYKIEEYDGLENVRF
jgi:hypothetical protein